MAIATQPLAGLEKTLNEYFNTKAPQMPKGLKEFLVKIAPWFTLLAVILAIPTYLTLLGIGGFSSDLGMAYAGTSTIVMLLGLVVVVLDALAIPGLFKRAKQGWNYLFYGALVGLVQNLVMVNILGFIIGALLSFYILFQIREYYK